MPNYKDPTDELIIQRLHSLNSEGHTPTYAEQHHTLFESNYATRMPIAGFSQHLPPENILRNDFTSSESLTVQIAPMNKLGRDRGISETHPFQDTMNTIMASPQF
jgi:hypothetical protein